MRHLAFRPAAPILLALLALLSGACRVDSPATDPAAIPMRPNAAATTIPTTPGNWTLTILHTGEMYGEVLPCG